MNDLINQIRGDKFLLLRVMLIGAFGGLIYFVIQKSIEAELPPPRR